MRCGPILLLLVASCDQLFGIEILPEPRDAALDAGTDAMADAADGALAGHDEDSDGVDDAIDPCPAVYELTQSDTDADGVGNVCDPHPNLPIDRIRYFESFQTFSPLRWRTVGGTWVQEIDQIRQTDGGFDNHMAMIDPDGLLVDPSISVVISELSGYYAGVWMVVPGAATPITGVGCYIYTPTPALSFYEKRPGFVEVGHPTPFVPTAYPAAVTLHASSNTDVSGEAYCTLVATSLSVTAQNDSADPNEAAPIPLARVGLYSYASSVVFTSVTVFDRKPQ